MAPPSDRIKLGYLTDYEKDRFVIEMLESKKNFAQVAIDSES